jgi:hypothetical protein
MPRAMIEERDEHRDDGQTFWLRLLYVQYRTTYVVKRTVPYFSEVWNIGLALALVAPSFR